MRKERNGWPKTRTNNALMRFRCTISPCSNRSCAAATAASCNSLLEFDNFLSSFEGETGALPECERRRTKPRIPPEVDAEGWWSGNSGAKDSLMESVGVSGSAGEPGEMGDTGSGSCCDGEVICVLRDDGAPLNDEADYLIWITVVSYSQ